jgi:hypothetical protein
MVIDRQAPTSATRSGSAGSQGQNRLLAQFSTGRAPRWAAFYRAAPVLGGVAVTVVGAVLLVAAV